MDPKANTLRIFKNIESLLEVGTFNVTGAQAKSVAEAQAFVQQMIAEMSAEQVAPAATEASDDSQAEKA